MKINKLGRKLWAYVGVGAGSLAIASAVVTTILVLSRQETVEKPTTAPTEPPTTQPSVETPSDEPVASTSSYCFPVEGATVLHSYGFFYNPTLNSYYEHQGIDFTVEEGTSVHVIADGVVESIFEDDVLRGGEICVLHEGGIKSLYTFVEAKNLKVGDKVKQGDLIGTVSSPSGEEYKDGAHLHLEVLAGERNIDPESILPFEEK